MKCCFAARAQTRNAYFTEAIAVHWKQKVYMIMSIQETSAVSYNLYVMIHKMSHCECKDTNQQPVPPSAYPDHLSVHLHYIPPNIMP